MSPTLYKVLGPDRTAYHGGSGQWPEPGGWIEAQGQLRLCKNGLHACRRQDLVQWVGPEIWTLEYDGEMLTAEDKVVVRKARLLHRFDTWNETTARLFACDCAERALSHVTKPDDRSVMVIDVARRFARGEATKKQLSAARAAARVAARAAAGADEREWQTDRLFQYLDGDVET